MHLFPFLPDARIFLQPGWLPFGVADALLARLLEEVPWEVHRIHIFGREVGSPRLSCWMGDPQASYRYSGTCFQPRPWLPALASLRLCLENETGAVFNSVLLNRYRHGGDAMGWHSDDESELGADPMIASLSLGASRCFVFRHRSERRLRAECVLSHGDLLLMGGTTQRYYQHALPRTSRVLGERINLTFRRILI
ncbi:MAG TPA: alpha-ketoglutarate-dependent dioxygenase AlkB family protein [Xylella taiwanensis]